MNKKILITGEIEIMSGLHIGGNSSFSAIGMIDGVVVKNKIDKSPVIPGSSLKGKMRTLLSRELNGKSVKIEDDGVEIDRLFGSSVKGKTKISRLQFVDMYLTEESKMFFKNENITPYEIKFENSIDRQKIVANPRQIERVVRGAKFGLTIIYNIDNESEINADMQNLIQAMDLIQLDYLGGGGTRGNGRIRFNNLLVQDLNENCELIKNEELTEKFSGVCEYGKICC